MMFKIVYSFLKISLLNQALAILVAMMPQVVTKFIERPCHVVLHGEARGLIAIDWLGRMKTNYKIKGAVSIIVELD